MPPASNSQNPLMMVLAAVGAGVTRVVMPDAAVAVAETFGFPLGLTLAVVLFLVVQSRIDSRDPKLLADTRTDSKTIIPFLGEEQL